MIVLYSSEVAELSYDQMNTDSKYFGFSLCFWLKKHAFSLLSDLIGLRSLMLYSKFQSFRGAKNSSPELRELELTNNIHMVRMFQSFDEKTCTL